MKPRYEKPPYQPRWLLQLQVWLLRNRVLPGFNRRSMVITTIGRKTGQERSVPIGFVRDGRTYLALNAGGGSNWYRNAMAHPQVRLNVDGVDIDTCAEPVPVSTPDQVQSVLDVYRRENPGVIEDFFQIPMDVPVEELLDIGKYISFVRFRPID